MSDILGGIVFFWIIGACCASFMCFMVLFEEVEPKGFAIVALWPVVLVLLSPIILIFAFKYAGEALGWVGSIYKEVIAR